MALKLTTTRRAAAEGGLKVLVHGPAGVGKTRLAATLPPGETLVVSCEGGLLALKDFDLPVIEIKEWADLDDAYNFIANDPQAAQFKWIVLDSFTDIAEACLLKEKKAAPDPRQAYGATQDRVFIALRKWRDMPGRNVYFIAKQKREKDEGTGATLYVPMMPGNALAQGVSYHFDEVFAMRIVNDAGGAQHRVLQTARDTQFDAKDRSSSLDLLEPADLGAIHAKIMAAIARSAQEAPA